MCDRLFESSTPTNITKPYILAWNLAKKVFSVDEMRERNCNGRRGKLLLDQNRLFMIHSLVFNYFPVGSNFDKDIIWKQCTQKIDTGIRNMFRYTP